MLIRIAWLCASVLLLVLSAWRAHSADATSRPPTSPAATNSNPVSYLIEASGRVLVSKAGAGEWSPATPGLPLLPRDRVRTEAASRAAIQLSDRSILRLSENTTLEIQAPVQSQTQRVRVQGGSLFFFHRGSPTDLEFETPLTTGAIRGTEFTVQVNPQSLSTEVALLDGQIEFTGSNDKTILLSLASGETAQFSRGQPPKKSSLLESRRIIQWALYYPAVLVDSELALSDTARTRLSASLELYRRGNLLAAQASAASSPLDDPSANEYLAALDLSVGAVDSAQLRLQKSSPGSPLAIALRNLIAAVRDPHPASVSSVPPQTASEWLAQSYLDQATFKLEAALVSARRATEIAPTSGFAHARVAELQLAFGRTLASETALKTAEHFAPDLPSVPLLRGFAWLSDHRPARAIDAFNQAIRLDPALGQAWLGRAIALSASHQNQAALQDLATAAALEPQRAIHRSYLGKAFSESRDSSHADREFELAQKLDPEDPTAWFYASLHHWQNQRINLAIREMEIALDKNDQQAVFRSRFLLDQDRAVRSASIAALYQEADLAEAGHQSASRAVANDYANSAAHLFLADSFNAARGRNRYDRRYQTAEFNELLLANLLAPAGAGNLSRVISQQSHLQFFHPKPLQLSSITEYRSDGDWYQAGSTYGTVDGTSYALDGVYEFRNGTQPNGKLERESYSLQIKQQLSRRDELFLEVSYVDQRSGDIGSYYDPNSAKTDFSVRERQEPNLFLGYHRIWSPNSHTLFLVSRLTDSLTLHDGQPNLLFLRQTAGNITSVSTPPLFQLDSHSDFELYSAELQHIWQTHRNTLIAGGRWQMGDVESDSTLTRTLTGVVTDQHPENELSRGSVYVFDHWSPFDSLTLMGGVSYDHLEYPSNADLPPLLDRESSRSRVSPKLGLTYTPWKGGQFRGAYTRSLGGLYFEERIRLEPSQIAGFNQAYRSLIPESVAGLVPGTLFETAHIAFDQSLRSGTYFGLGAEWLTSEGEREVGALTNGGFLPVPDTATSTSQSLSFRERSLSFYAVQLIGNDWSIGSRYRISHAELDGTFPGLPSTAAGLASLEQHEQALLHKVDLTLRWQHPSGFFGQWDSSWMHQDSDGYTPARSTEDLWQHNIQGGYRFAQRRAEIRLGLLNITDQDYRLSPLNFTAGLPRHRTLVVSLQLHF